MSATRRQPDGARLGPRTLTDLQWARIKSRALEHCQTDVGRASLRADHFRTDADEVRAELGLVSELRSILDVTDRRPPLGGAQALGPLLRRTLKEGVLEGEELVAVSRTVQAGHHSRLFLEGHVHRAEGVCRIARKLPDLEYLFRRLEDTFESDGSVKDDASPRLAELRSRIARLHGRLRTQVAEHLHDREIEDMLQDDYYTMREDRYVLPVKAAHRNAVDGIVHGSSNTGQTVYIEPEALIRTNNELKLAEQEVEHEVWLIRKRCSEMVAEVADEIEESVSILARLDSLAARATLSQEMKGAAPEICAGGALLLKGARNPLLVLQGDKVVPNDVVAGDGFQILVISGPNTGGKTVTLSTLGLAVLMAQAGYHVVARPDSRVPVFGSIFTSMGDAQNIERGLSTFSGHLEALSEILGGADENSLLLLDEILVGTEPSQGSALAAAFLEQFAACGVTAAVATHYDRLKTLSYADPRFRNASVGLDPDRMVPNFKLSTGLPGSSSPIAIAERLGIGAEILDRAHQIIGGEALNLDEVVRDLEAEREGLAEERKRLEREANEAEKARRRLEEEAVRLRRESTRLAREACLETLNLADSMRKELNTMRREIRRRNVTEKELEGRRRRVKDIEQGVKAATPADPDAPPPVERRALKLEELKPGMTVWVASFDREGTLGEPIKDKRRIPVTVGSLRTTVAVKDLFNAGGGKPSRGKGGVEGLGKGRPSFTGAVENYDDRTPPPKVSDNTADLRGMMRDEALELLDKTLDECASAGRPVLWVVHGHGTGVIKNAVRDYLGRSPYASHFRPGSRKEGGDGVTLVWLD